MRLSILAVLLTATALSPAMAQMNTMTVTNGAQEEAIMESSKAAPIPSGGYIAGGRDKKTTEAETTPAEKAGKADKSEEKKDDLKPLPAPKLTPAKDLKAWDQDKKLFTARGNPDRIKRVLADFTSEPGRINPRGLFEVAELYWQQNDKRNAAQYYYAAQLRARFDYFRWPGRGADDANPYFALSQTAATMGGTIGAWATSTSARLTEALNDARTWDAATPYDYHPGADIPTGENIPKEDEWPKLLEKARDQFFRDGMGIASALKALGQ
jgi:hypothetical protein